MGLKVLHLRQPEWAPAHVASFLVVTAAVSSVTMTLDPCPYVVVVFLFLLLGALASAAPVVSDERTAQRVRTGALMLALVSIPAISLWISPAAIMPDEALDTRDLQTAVLMGWLLVGLTFVVHPPRRNGVHGLPLSFLAVPSLTVFGLIASLNSNPEIVVAFLLFLAATLFLVSYEQMLARGLVVVSPRRSLVRVLQEQALVTGTLFGLVFVLGCTGMVLFGWASPGYAVGSAVSRIRGTGRKFFYQTYGSWASQLRWFRVGDGPIPSSDVILMTVTTSEPIRLRGRAYARYTGHGWERGLPSNSALERIHAGRDGIIRLAPGRLPHHRLVRQTVEPTVDMPSLLFTAGVPVRVWGRHLRLVAVDRFGCVFPSSVQYAGARYTVESLVPEFTRDQLLRADEPGFAETVDSGYLEVPNSATAVFALVPRIIAGARTPYAKAEAILHYLAATCTYDASAGRVPRAADVADYFLTRSKRGACDQFATAAVLLCRAAGIPARIVVGYMLEGPIPGTHRYVARERDAHAWIEVLIPGCGWIPLDPTAGASPGPSGGGFFEDFMDNVTLPGALRWLRHNAFWTAFGVLLVYLVWLLYSGWREEQSLAGRRRRSFSAGQRAVIDAYLHFCRSLSRVGAVRAPAQTPAEFAASLQTDPRLPASLTAGAMDLTEAFCLVRYAGVEPGSETVRRAVRFRRRLPQWLKPVRAPRRPRKRKAAND